MTKEELKAKVEETVYTNGTKSITAASHQELLLQMVDDMYPGLAYSTAEKAIGTDYTGKIIYQRIFLGALRGAGQGQGATEAKFSIGQTVTSLWLDSRCYLNLLTGKKWPVVGLAEERVFPDEGFGDDSRIQTRYKLNDPQVSVVCFDIAASVTIAVIFAVNYTKD
jgi:hypothetical protein